ncbi:MULTISPECIES: type II toxin-antitoxin system VapC family toxin [unclassified Rhizobium]|uniref:type II toxin-antitoxin system VapC family toxin n=1 Tax=unclassified Rhizobium TaxID=2613769 RepID=UPI000EA8DC23|nr:MULTISPECIES: type II toxin-antitoxin system VapC family toxin [unclassified Rhizobium]AYG67101.1 type II toxin-antitoxin system VapC family toxin [Rhizobium sp. CCGE531]AYG73478.1 type II toxin-antitoxin system VapC family toxin [Rhizobium sp. CCGE532]
MYLVDTNVISEVRRGNSQAVAWLRSIDPSTVYLSVITLGEIMRGIALKRKSDPRAAAHLEEWLRKIRHDHGNRILAITDQIAVEWGRIAAQRPRGDADGLIAATAIVHDLIVVTRNVGDFDDTGASIINPWDQAPY